MGRWVHIPLLALIVYYIVKIVCCKVLFSFVKLEWMNAWILRLFIALYRADCEQQIVQYKMHLK